jgi:hypothetical protein
VLTTIILAEQVSPDFTDFTIVIRGDTSNHTLTFSIDPAPVAPLHLWSTARYAPFKDLGTVSASGSHVTVTVEGDSILSLTTISDAQHVEFAVPQRSSFPLPFFSNFELQDVASPGKFLSDVWGSFEVVSALASGGSGSKVLRQSAVGCPIVWHTHSGSSVCGDSDPFTCVTIAPALYLKVMLMRATPNAEGALPATSPTLTKTMTFAEFATGCCQADPTG